VLKLILEKWISVFGKPSVIRSDNDVRFRQQSGFYQTAFKALDVKLSFSLPRNPKSNGLVENVNKMFLQNMRALSLTMKDNNWVQLIPYCTFLMNAQVAPTTMLSPHEMFLGRPAWRFDLPPEPVTNPETFSWLMTQVEIQEKASKRLKELRKSSCESANKRRVDTNIKEDDYVLVHNKRWPNKSWPKLSPLWQGPFRVLKARFNSVQVASSPSLGGVIDVSLGLCKKWEVGLHESEILEDEERGDLLTSEKIFEDQVQVGGDTPMQDKGGDTPIQMTEEEQAQLGFYNVYRILKHKYQGGWKFLVWWENFPASSSTWEPVASFVQPNGKINEVFKKYLVDHNLQQVLRQALRIVCGVLESELGTASCEHAWPPPKCFHRALSHEGEKPNPTGVVLDGFLGEETPAHLAMGGLLFIP
jgi:hypothetical protein